MTITLSKETQAILEDLMQSFGFESPDQAIHTALLLRKQIDEQTTAAADRDLDKQDRDNNPLSIK